VEDNRFGIPFAGEFHGHHEHEGEEHAEEEAGHEEEEHLDIDVASDRRDVRADLGFRNLSGSFVDTVKLTIGHTNYGMDEIEIAEGVETVATAFNNDTTTIRAELEQPAGARMAGRLGLDFFTRDYSAAGEEALAPPTSQRSLAAFVYEEMPLGRARLQFGGRIERNTYDVEPRPELEGHEDEEEGLESEAGAEEEDHEAHEPPEVRNREFTGASGSLGLHTDIGAYGAFVANVSLASRAPALEELYNFGPHVGNLAFEVGNPELEMERTVGLDVSLRSRAPRANGELNFFVYQINNFVFFDFTGEEIDGLREADFLQGDSRFAGFEAAGHFEVSEYLHVAAGLNYVQAKLTDTDESLPRIPPLSGRLALEVPWRGLTFAPEVLMTADQDDVFRDETPTPGSTVLNLGLTYVRGQGHATHTIALKAYNLTDETYRLHTSFIKDLAPEMGRGVRVTYAVKFF
jgi:iron complex outermembrane receptor protein